MWDMHKVEAICTAPLSLTTSWSGTGAFQLLSGAALAYRNPLDSPMHNIERIENIDASVVGGQQGACGTIPP
jgi:hypothetical protein